MARRRPQRPTRLPSIPTFPRGPKALDFSGAPKVGGPGEPPPGFISPSNSRAEWMIYWAMAKVIGTPNDPRKPPFIGAHGLWEYQRAYGQYATPGSTTIDFVVFPQRATRGRGIALRIVTERYHELVDPRKRAKDIIQKRLLSTSYETKDLHEVHFITDESGQSAVRLVKFVLAGGTSPDPFLGRAGNLRIRDPDL